MGWFNETFKRQGMDEHGQPLNRMYRARAVQERQVDELIGLVKGVLADGAICQGEVQYLLKWIESNRTAADQWPANVLYPRIATALADGHMDEEEEREIMSLLISTVGNRSLPKDGEASHSTALPLCHPTPTIRYAAQTFCFTGKFNSGTRDWCGRQVHDRGGFAASGITKKLNYLVIGEIGSRDWLHSTHGLKIKKALEYRDAGQPLHIVSEQHWYGSIQAQD